MKQPIKLMLCLSLVSFVNMLRAQTDTTVSDTVSWKNLDKTEYSLQYPDTFTYVEPKGGMVKIEFYLSSPIVSIADKFSEKHQFGLRKFKGSELRP